MEKNSRISVLFVCMGNICRSPTAEGVFRYFVEEAGLSESIEVDSAGTHAYHTNEPADRRAQAAAERRGYSMSDIRARRVRDEDFERFDVIIAMDRRQSSLRSSTRQMPSIMTRFVCSSSIPRCRKPRCLILIMAAPPVSNAFSTWLKKRLEVCSRRCTNPSRYPRAIADPQASAGALAWAPASPQSWVQVWAPASPQAWVRLWLPALLRLLGLGSGLGAGLLSVDLIT